MNACWSSLNNSVNLQVVVIPPVSNVVVVVAIAAVPAEVGSWRDDKEIKSRASMNILF